MVALAIASATTFAGAIPETRAHIIFPSGALEPRLHLHYTPTYSFWLNQIEIWFSKIQRDFIARGVFNSKTNPARRIMRYILQQTSSIDSNGPTAIPPIASNRSHLCDTLH